MPRVTSTLLETSLVSLFILFGFIHTSPSYAWASTPSTADPSMTPAANTTSTTTPGVTPPDASATVPVVTTPAVPAAVVQPAPADPQYLNGLNGTVNQTIYTVPTSPLNVVQANLVHPTIPYTPQVGDYFDIQGEGLAVWTQFPVKVYVEYPNNFPSNAKDDLIWAISAWKPYVPMEITRDKKLAQIHIEWVSDIKEHNAERYGQANYNEVEPGTNGRDTLKAVDLKLLAPDHYMGLPDTAMKGVFLHELGHALGLKKDSDVEGDAMASPDVSNNKSKMIKQAVQTLAMKGLDLALKSQGITLSLLKAVTTPQAVQPTVNVAGQLSSRDLNTMYRLYNQDQINAQNVVQPTPDPNTTFQIYSPAN